MCLRGRELEESDRVLWPWNHTMYFIVQLVNTMKKTMKLGMVTRMKLNCNNNTSSSQFVISLCLCRPGNLIPGIGATSGNTLIWSEEIIMIQSSQICGIH